jgi:hypothetical protein
VLSPRLRSELKNFTSCRAIGPLQRDFETKTADQPALDWMILPCSESSAFDELPRL